MSEVDSTPVEYRLVPEMPWYRVGNDGSVWTRIRSNTAKDRYERFSAVWRQLKLANDRGGRLKVELASPSGPVQRAVHRLVLEAFVGPCPDGMEACHFPDRNPKNNRLDNLRWDAREANGNDSRIQGIHRGSRNPRAKLTDEQVSEIRAIGRKMSTIELSARFGVSTATISRVLLGRSWGGEELPKRQPKLTDDDVRLMRSLFPACTVAELSARFNVVYSHVHAIVTNRKRLGVV